MNYDVLQYINGHSVVCSFMENSIGLKSENDFLMRCVKSWRKIGKQLYTLARLFLALARIFLPL